MFNTIKLLAISSLLLTATLVRAETIKLVSSLPRTGSANAQSTAAVNGIRLAIKEVGAKVGAFDIAYEDWDDASPERGAWDPTIEATNAEKAINDSDVMIYIGPYNSGAAKISMPKLNHAGLAIVNAFATMPGLTKPATGEANEPLVYRPSGKLNFFRVIPADDIQGAVGAKWAMELGAKKAFVLNDREAYGKGIAEMFKRTAATIGLEIVGFEGIDPKAANYRALANKIRQANPDIVYFGGTTQTNAGQIVKDLRSIGLKTNFMAPDGCFESAFIAAAGAQNVEGNTYLTFGGVPPEKLEGAGRDFVTHYVAEFGTQPEAYATYGYEAARVALDAIARAGKKDREAIRSAVAATKDFKGLLGTWSFDENGDTSIRTMSGSTVRNGKFEFVKLLG